LAQAEPEALPSLLLTPHGIPAITEANRRLEQSWREAAAALQVLWHREEELALLTQVDRAVKGAPPLAATELALTPTRAAVAVGLDASTNLLALADLAAYPAHRHQQ
jgi:hypothetical protein